MRKLSLAVSIAALSAVPALTLADIYDARSMGRGGAGLTMGEYNQAVLNPALINHFDENDDFSFALNAGVFASDKDRRVPGGELHTNFKLSAGGDYLALVRPDGVAIEHEFAPTYPNQLTDISYG